MGIGCLYLKKNKYSFFAVEKEKADYDHEELLDMDVSIAITTLRDLMVENEIPHEVSYEDFADIKF